MKIGMNLPVMEPGLDRAFLRDWITRIDAGPFSSIALGERIAYSNPEVITLVAACAALTERVRVVTTVIVLTMHDPVLMAKQLATIDVLSGGRLSGGVGIGGREEDYRAIGADLDARKNAQLAERVAILRRVWAGAKVVDTIEPVGPTPVQPGGPEILAGSLRPIALRLAAGWAASAGDRRFARSVTCSRSHAVRGAMRAGPRPPD